MKSQRLPSKEFCDPNPSNIPINTLLFFVIVPSFWLSIPFCSHREFEKEWRQVKIIIYFYSNKLK
jgi:hypothetical protein